MTSPTPRRRPMTPERLLSLQMSTGSMAMTILRKLLSEPKPSDEQWVEQVNTIAEQIAALATLALDTEPPAELAGAYNHWKDAAYSWHRAVTDAFETYKADVASGTRDRQGWQRAIRRWRRGWNSYARARRELQRVRARRVMARQTALSMAKLDIVA